MKYLLWAAIAAAVFWAWRSVGRSGPGLSPFEASRLLEVPVDADSEAVLAAHRRLIAKVHPDAGGSAALAQRVNEARDVLLNRQD